MKKIKALLLFVIPVFLYAQEGTKGVHFEQNLNWKQILAKAKTENKYIFVDCFATWCRPCKAMDQNIYPLQSVGDQMNDKFISVKVQMDVTKEDNEQVKSWYSDARNLMTQYSVKVFPSFLFFSPDGKMVHKGVDYEPKETFVDLLHNALNPEKQNYTLLEKYKQGKIDYAAMPYLVHEFYSLLEDSLANQIACDYIHNYLEKLSEKDLVKKENFNFAFGHVDCINSRDKIFDLCFHQPDKVDSIVNFALAFSSMGGLGNGRNLAPHYITGGLVNDVISKEEITPVLAIAKSGNSDPDWNKAFKSIKRKYGEKYARFNVTVAKMKWYQAKKDWKNYTKYLVPFIEERKPETMRAGLGWDIYLNNSAFDVFMYSDNKKELRKALSWVDLALVMRDKPYADALDTKANILYKLGRKADGIALEEQAVKLKPKDKAIQKNWEMMKKNEPTWFIAETSPDHK